MAAFKLPNWRLGKAGKILEKIARVMKTLNPVPNVGGLEISETALRFFAFRGGSIVTKSLRLPPGVIQGGRVGDRQSFIEALKSLRAQAGPLSKPLHAVVLLPPAAVYAEAFRLPDLSDEKLAEAAELNMQMLSPTDPNSTYMSAEKIGEIEETGGQVDLLGAFAEKNLVDEILTALEEGGFIVAAVEFPALAVARLVSRLSDTASRDPYLALQLTGDGLMIMILKNNRLYFSRFVSWMAMREELGRQALSEADLGNVVSREVQQVMNFWGSRWGHPLGEAVVVAEQLNEQIGKILTTMFSLNVREVVIRELPNLPVIWWPSLGAALRGLVPRGEDAAISLTPATIKARYWSDRVLLFTGLWQKILILSFAFIFLVLVGFDLFLLGRERAAERAGEIVVVSPANMARLLELQEKAAEFNTLVGKASAAGGAIPRWVPFLTKLDALARGLVEFTQVSIQGRHIALAGTAGVEVAVIQFKDRLVGEKDFENISFPIASIKTSSREGVTFTLTFELASLTPLFGNSITPTSP